MDWARAIERNREALKGIVAALFAMLEQAGGLTAARLPRPLHRAVLSVLRPAESAVRRLIVIAARGLVAKPARAQPMPSGPIGRSQGRRPSFPLFDPRKRFAHQRRRTRSGGVPRIRILGHDPTVASLWAARLPTPAPPKDDTIDARRLYSRLEVLKQALENLPRQARRLVRLRAKREKAPSFRPTLPLRPGRAPGYRKRPVHAVDHVLAECHGLAWYALEPVAAPSTMLTHGPPPPLRG